MKIVFSQSLENRPIPCRFFLQNQNRDIFHEDISILMKLFQIVRKLEYMKSGLR